MLIKVSYKWANKIINCTFDGIQNGCNGKCCKGTSFYPSKSNTKNGHTVGQCALLTEKGCILEDKEKSIKCLLYPFVINENNSLVLHGRALTSMCKECYNKGNKPIIETQRQNFSYLFGKELVDRMIKATVQEQRAFLFRTDLIFDNALKFEEEMEYNNKVPIPRSEYWGK